MKKKAATIPPVARVRPGFLQDALCDHLSAAIRFGLLRAFKHWDDPLRMTEDQEKVICASILQEVENAIHDALDFGEYN